MNVTLTSSDSKFGLEISVSLLQVMAAHCKKAWPNEIGGVLIGRYNSARSLAQVTQAEPPTADSRGGRTWFHRGSQGLRQLLTSLWDRPEEQREYYLGEWHYHPDGAPSPSPKDRTQMQILAEDPDCHCPEPLLLIIGGSPKRGWSLGVFVFPRGKPHLDLARGMAIPGFG